MFKLSIMDVFTVGDALIQTIDMKLVSEHNQNKWWEVWKCANCLRCIIIAGICVGIILVSMFLSFCNWKFWHDRQRREFDVMFIEFVEKICKTTSSQSCTFQLKLAFRGIQGHFYV